MGVIGNNNNNVVLDFKQGDVNGDGIIDNVYLTGLKSSDQDEYVENITIVIENGQTKKITLIDLKTNGGYNGHLFLGDFNEDNILDILVRIDSGGTGRTGFFYIFSFKNNTVTELFDYEAFEEESLYDVIYKDYYKVDVINNTTNEIYTIDVADRAQYYTDMYDQDGKLIKPTEGGVLGLGALYPVFTEKGGNYNLLALQRIIGIFNGDSLGNVQTFLAWDGNSKFRPQLTNVSIMARL